MLCNVCLHDKPRPDFSTNEYKRGLAQEVVPICLKCCGMSIGERKIIKTRQLKMRRQELGGMVEAKDSEGPPDMDKIRSNLINNCTRAEKAMRALLEEEKIAYEFQSRIGPYFPDFTLVREKLIIEVDGGYHNNPIQKHDDKLRTQHLERMKYKVVRYTNKAVLSNPEWVITNIRYWMRIRNPLSTESGIVAVNPKPAEVAI